MDYKIRILVIALTLPLLLCHEAVDTNDLSDWLENLNFNPDEDLDTVQIARRHGYPAETHIVQTEDGYLLSVHRIPGSKNGRQGGQPVFLQHGLFSSSSDWVVNSNQSLAFLLADAGYDVWLGNARGNTYSRAHVSLSVNSAQFWNYSWHEMGVYDLPAVLYHVSNVTSKPGQILYIGHSMGTTMFFVFASLKPQAAKNVKFMAALAPSAFMAHVRSPIRYLTPWAYDIEWIARHVGINEFLPNHKLIKFLAYECKLLHVEKEICENLVFIFSGFDKSEFNMDIIPVVLSHDPSSVSTKTVMHYAQEVKNNGTFRQYDYGPYGNKVKYGTLIPPAYKLSDIKVPIYLMYAENDGVVSPIDVETLFKKLKKVEKYKVPLDHFDHIDFLFGKNVGKVVYKPLINILQNYTEDILF